MSMQAVVWALGCQELPLDRRTGRIATAAKVVLIALANYASPDGTDAFPSVGTLAHTTGLSERAVQYTLAALVEHGTIRPTPDPLKRDSTVRRGDQMPNSYDLTMTQRGAKSEPPHVQRGAKSEPTGCKLSDDFAPDPVREPIQDEPKPQNLPSARASGADSNGQLTLDGTPAPVKAKPARKPKTEQPTRANEITDAWIVAFSATGTRPTPRQIGAVARTAREVLLAGNDFDQLAAAARSAGSRGYTSIDRELAQLANGRNGTRNGHRPYIDTRSDDDYSGALQ